MLSLLCLETSELRLPGWSLSPVTSAGKAVDCAVISARVNVTTRPTAQTTTSSSAWPRVSFASCSSSLRFLQPHWIPCPGQSRVPVRKRARKMACVRNKNETETPPKHRHGGRKKKRLLYRSHISCTGCLQSEDVGGTCQTHSGSPRNENPIDSHIKNNQSKSAVLWIIMRTIHKKRYHVAVIDCFQTSKTFNYSRKDDKEDTILRSLNRFDLHFKY